MMKTRQESLTTKPGRRCGGGGGGRGGEEVGVPFDGLAFHSGEKQYSCSLYTNLLKKP